MLALLGIGLGGSLARAKPPEIVAGSFSLLVIPDTQVYAWKYPATYEAQMRWAAANAKKYNLVYMLHLGDVTEHNTAVEWEVARNAHRLLDGRLPFAMSTGNHDYPERDGGPDSRQSMLSDYFPVTDFRSWPSYGGLYDREPQKLDNNYHLFQAGGRKWLVLALEFAPRDDVLRWANEVVKKYPDRTVILITHAYLQPSNLRYDRTKSTAKHFDRYSSRLEGGVNDGEDMWRKLVSPNPNVGLVICGHVGVTGRLTSTNDGGQAIEQMVVDYQQQPEGGGGFLRLLTFLPDGKTVRTRDYSPVSDLTIAEPDRVYDFQIMPAPPEATTR